MTVGFVVTVFIILVVGFYFAQKLPTNPPLQLGMYIILFLVLAAFLLQAFHFTHFFETRM